MKEVVEIIEENEEEIENLPGHSATKPVYLVKLIDPFKNIDFFVSYKLDYGQSFLKIQGWKIPIEINNLKDAEKHAERETYYDIHFPWHRVLSIRNITFKRG